MDTDLEPGTPVTRTVKGPNGLTEETRHGVVVRKLKTRYLIRWDLRWATVESAHKRIEGTHAFY